MFEIVLKGKEGVSVLKEVPSPISKIKNKYRFRIIIKNLKGVEINEEVISVLNGKELDKVNSEFTVDFNPVSFN